MQQQPGNWLTTLIPFVIIAVVIGLRMRSMSKERPLKVETLWVVPVIYLALVGFTFVTLRPSPLGWGLMLFGIAIGGAIGWHRGKLISIHRDEQSGELRQKASPLAMLLIVGLIVLKMGARSIFGDTAVAHPSSGAMLLTDAFLGFALGLLTATRVELYLRAQKILATA